jgi:nucleotide-binding universal stress UspA family protein
MGIAFHSTIATPCSKEQPNLLERPMNAETIVVPTDFSLGAKAAVECATELAKSLNATLLIAHVELAPALSGPYDDEDDPREHQAHRLLEVVKPTSAAVTFQSVLLKGNVAEEILHLAKDRCADAIVMGTHGQTNSPEQVMGAVAEAVTRQSPCLVIAVKPPAVLP